MFNGDMTNDPWSFLENLGVLHISWARLTMNQPQAEAKAKVSELI